MALAGILIWLMPAVAQIQTGDLTMSANGNVSAGYGGGYGNFVQSSHNIDVGFDSILNGSYYSPNFLSFSLAPYYNRSSTNSSSQSISSASGLNFNSSIFAGSHFPGSVGYSENYNSAGTFNVPGSADLTTHGNSHNFNVNWSELIPDLPSLSVGFSKGGNNYSVYGLDQTGNTNSHTFNLRSAYRILGFNTSGYYSNSASDSTFPSLVAGAVTEDRSTSHSSSYGFGTGHIIPLRGMFSLSYNHTNLNSDYLGYHFNGGIDTTYVSAGIQPTNKLHLQATTGYNNNLTGTLFENTLNPGQATTPTVPSITSSGPSVVNTQTSSHSWDMQGGADYAFLPNLSGNVYAQRRVQSYLGLAFGANSYGGGLTYTRTVLGGSFSAFGSVSDNTRDHSDVNSLGFSAAAGYNRRLGAWAFGGNFSYAQNVQTLLISYTNSYYTYSGNVRRKFSNQVIWSLTAAGSRSGITAQPHSDSSSQSYGTGIGYGRWIGANASYSKSTGNGLLTAGGISPTPLPPIIPPELLILYGGKSYSFGLSSNPTRRFTVAASFSHANSNVFNGGIGSWNKSEQFGTSFHYQFRKMVFTGGYNRLLQGTNASPLGPENLSSFFIGVSRWFNFF